MIEREIGCKRNEIVCCDCSVPFVQREYPSIPYREWVRCAACAEALWARMGHVVRRWAA